MGRDIDGSSIFITDWFPNLLFVFIIFVGKTIAIFFGSQTGTAEEFSQRLSKDAQRYSLKAGIFDPEECNFAELTEMKDEIEQSLAVFVVATYGEGDPTDNALQLSDWLKEEQSLDGLNFAVFALGNKTYEHYQAFGRFVNKRLEELGGQRLLEIGEGMISFLELFLWKPL